MKCEQLNAANSGVRGGGDAQGQMIITSVTNCCTCIYMAMGYIKKIIMAILRTAS